MATKKGTPKPKPTTTHKLRGPHGRLTVPLVEAALRASAGIQSVAAEKLRVNRSSICRFVQDHPQLRNVIDEISTELVDLAVAKVIEGIGKGDFSFIKYYLDHKGEAAGYGNVRRINLTGRVAVKTSDIDLSKVPLDKLEQIEAILAAAALESDAASD